MKRTTNSDPDALLWKKIGGGSFAATINGRRVIIKPGETFLARPDEIPLGQRDVIVPADPVDLAKKEQNKEEKISSDNAPKYSLSDRGGSWWDVVSADGKVQNEKALRKPAAEELLAALS